MKPPGEPIFPLDGEHFYLRMWFISGEAVDWLGAIYRKGKDGPWQLTYRFRYDAGTGDDFDDRKSVYRGTVPDGLSAKEVLIRVRPVIDAIAQDFGGGVHELMLSTANPKTIYRALTKEKFSHFYARSAAGKHVRLTETEVAERLRAERERQ